MKNIVSLIQSKPFATNLKTILVQGMSMFYLILTTHECIIPGGGAGVAAAAVGGRGGHSGGSLVGGVELCIAVCHWTPGWFENG